MTSTDRPHPEFAPRKRLAWVLAALFALSIIMGAGPGVLLVNRPDAVFGIPLIYAWGVVWYLVQVAVALIAYFALWSKASDDGHRPPSESAKGGPR